MNFLKFRELVGALPRGDEFRPKKYPAGFSTVRQPNPNFVQPELIEEIPLAPGSTSVVLLSAPGAVGKSTLAAELAFQLGAPLWDLSKIQVGSLTFAGTIMEAYGFEATGQMKRLQDGRCLLVIDALDEAQVRAGGQNFDAFLVDLVDILKGKRERPVIALLARSDTADWIELIFQEAKVPLARYKIAYFDKRQAEAFIERRLDARRASDGQKPAHRQQRGPFSEARDELFQLVYRLFSLDQPLAWSDPRIRDFLGYAPVLETLTDYLDVTNFISLKNEVRENIGVARNVWHFLTDVLNKLLKREQAKLRCAIQPQLQATADATGWSNWDSLYGVDEQCARVLSHSIRLENTFADLQFPPRLALAYEEALKTQLPQHPFLAGRGFANVIFREYSYAWGQSRGAPAITNVLRKVMRGREEPFLPSPLFSYFIINLAGDNAATVDGEDFGIFYEAMLAGDRKPALEVVSTGEALEALFLPVHENDEEIKVAVLDTGQGLHFWRKLHSADIDVGVDVRLGLPEDRFVLGPLVHLICKGLVVECDTMDIDVKDDVSIQAESYLANVPDLRLRVRNTDTGRLRVTWPSVGHPWVAYKSEIAQSAASLAETVRGDTLRKLIMMFRRQRSRRASTLRGARWSHEQQTHRDELIELAERRGVLTPIVGIGVVAFNSEYDSLMTLVEGAPNLSANARAFIAEFLGPEQIDRILAR